MLRFASLLTLAVAVRLAIAQTPTECIAECSTTAATDAGCAGFTDFSCICFSDPFKTQAEACIRENCPDELQTALGLQQIGCSGASPPIISDTDGPISGSSSSVLTIQTSTEVSTTVTTTTSGSSTGSGTSSSSSSAASEPAETSSTPSGANMLKVSGAGVVSLVALVGASLL